MTTTDDFTEAARAEAKAFVLQAMDDAWDDGREYGDLPRVLAERLPEWARTHFAAQEPTDTTPLQERVETALLRATDDGADRTEEYAAAVLPIIAAEVRRASERAWDEGYIAPIEAAAHNPYRREAGDRA